MPTKNHNAEERSCYDCHNFRAKIPLTRAGKAARRCTTARQMLPLRIAYPAATASCRCGHLLKTDGETRIFKNVLREPVN
ncbi:MAG TPA: hypothetical protein ENN95_02185, partial [Deltaproteobacteria bacterium]|nr:hypothetical protein [Deltaproteobacteria bacterium]